MGLQTNPGSILLISILIGMFGLPLLLVLCILLVNVFG